MTPGAPPSLNLPGSRRPIPPPPRPWTIDHGRKKFSSPRAFQLHGPRPSAPGDSGVGAPGDPGDSAEPEGPHEATRPLGRTRPSGAPYLARRPEPNPPALRRESLHCRTAGGGLRVPLTGAPVPARLRPPPDKGTNFWTPDVARAHCVAYIWTDSLWRLQKDGRSDPSRRSAYLSATSAPETAIVDSHGGGSCGGLDRRERPRFHWHSLQVLPLITDGHSPGSSSLQ